MTGPGALQRINVLIDQAQWAQAEAAIRRALASDSKNIDLAALMSFVLLRQAKLQQAEFFARQVAQARPSDPYALHNCGNILITMGRFEEGLPFVERAISINPAEPQIHQARAMGLNGLHRYASAAAALREGLRHCPGDHRLLNLQAYLLQWMGRVEEALPILQAVVAQHPGDGLYAEHLASMVSYAPGLTDRQILDANLHYGRLEEARYGPARIWKPQELRDRLARSLHIGLISPDLRNHAVAFLSEALLDHADPKEALIFCYSACSREDAVSRRIREKAHRWRSVYHVSVDDAAKMIEGDRVDVLIDLAGHTNGNRLNVLARKPAPVQMTYMGFPSTTGLRTMDYRIVDSITDPPGDESLASEKLLRLDPCFLSYRPPENPPPVSPLPCGDDGPITFGAFSALIKFNTPMLGMWARVLKAVPSSRLLLKHFAFAEEQVRTDVTDRLVAAGANPDQVSALPPEPTAREVLPWYHKVDIALDTFPYNGTTTFCEAFLMGVPMVSLRGRTPPSRVGKSLLATVGLEDLCAATEDEFVSIAAALASDRARLRQIRATLRERFLGSTICDGPGFARRMTRLCGCVFRAAAGLPEAGAIGGQL